MCPQESRQSKRGALPVLVCALEVEERAARRGRAHIVRVGIGAALGIPDESFIAFGLAGGLVAGLEPGALLTATRIVDEDGRTLWEGDPLPLAGAEHAVLCAVNRVVDDPRERLVLAERSGAVAVDMESGALAASGNLRGVVRAISDTVDQPLSRLARAATIDGRVAWGAILGSFARDPIGSAHTAVAGRRALAALERAASAFASTQSGS